MGRIYTRKPLRERLLAKIRIDPQTGCWNWTGAKNGQSGGLVAINVGINKRRQVTAAAAAYSEFKDPVPAGWFVLNECGNYSCINPDHVRVSPTKVEDFSTRVDRYKAESATGCHEWQGSLDKDGYGMISVIRPDGRKTTGRAHRVSYELNIGPIPAGLEIDHACRNRRCINPLHLRPMTTLENILIGTGQGAMNARKTRCVHGHTFDGGNTVWHVQKNGRMRRSCRTCRNRRAKLAARRKDPAERRAYQRRHCAANRQHYRDKYRRWKAANPEKYRAAVVKTRAKTAANRETINERRRELYAAKRSGLTITPAPP